MIKILLNIFFYVISLPKKSDGIKEKQITRKKTELIFCYGEFHAKQANTYKSRSKRPKLINLGILSAISISSQRTRVGDNERKSVAARVKL